MIQVENSQLTTACSQWREALREHRQSLTDHKTHLQDAAGAISGREQLRELEQLQNQLHVQLINVHDLKQLIKQHERTIAYDLSARNRKIRRETVADHELLSTEFQRLQTTLKDLDYRFQRFLVPA
jgi:hypothetical protein